MIGVAEDSDKTAEASTTAENAPETVAVADGAPKPAEDLAWSIADNAPSVKLRHPLSPELKILLSTVGVGAVALAAFVAGQHMMKQRATTAPSSARTVTVTAPPPAAATTTTRPDDAYFMQLVDHDKLPHGDVRSTTGEGLALCRLMKYGESEVQAAAEARNTQKLTQQQAEFFVADAIVAYCPHAGM